MKRYVWHPCASRHASWPAVARCCWPHAEVDGDGPYAATDCGRHTIALHTAAEQAQALVNSYDLEGCRPRCYGRHTVVDLTGALEHGKPTSLTTRRATTPAAPPPSEPAGPVCGQPRTNGRPCRRPAGWGADPGEASCRDHGGSIAQRLAEKEQRVEAARAFAELAEQARTRPLTAEEEQQLEAAARVVLKGRRTRHSGSLTGLVPEVPGWAEQWLGLLLRCGRGVG